MTIIFPNGGSTKIVVQGTKTDLQKWMTDRHHTFCREKMTPNAVCHSFCTLLYQYPLWRTKTDIQILYPGLKIVVQKTDDGQTSVFPELNYKKKHSVLRSTKYYWSTTEYSSTCIVLVRTRIVNIIKDLNDFKGRVFFFHNRLQRRFGSTWTRSCS